MRAFVAVHLGIEQYFLPILETELGYRIAYQEAFAAGQGVTGYDPKNVAAAEIRDLVDELNGFNTVEEKIYAIQ